MTLYLSSDEKTLDERNTRTKFKNRILPDFFNDNSFNLKLHEIFFDSKFPTLANFEYPHIITTIIGKEHKLQDFPMRFKKNSLFKYLCKDYGNKEFSPFLVDKHSVFESSLSEIDFEVFYEIHPRLNFAFSIAYIKDVNIHSQKGLINFLNSFMFPFHKRKPLKYLENGYVEIETNLNLFMSKNLLQLLGFNSFKFQKSENHLNVPIKTKYLLQLLPDVLEESFTSSINVDMLNRLEYKYSEYSSYRSLINQNPKGVIRVQFSIGSSLQHFAIEYDLNLFHQNTKAVNYDEELDVINRLALGKYLSVIKDYVLNLKITSTEEDKEDLINLIDFLSKDRRGMDSLKRWGGLFTLKRTIKNHVTIELFQTEKNKTGYKHFHSNINKLDGAPLVKQASHLIHDLCKLVNISFNPTLCHFLGVSKFTSSFKTIDVQGEQDILLPFPLNYYKSVRHELSKSFTENAPFPLQLIQLQEENESLQSSKVMSIKTDQDEMFIIDNKGGSFFSDEAINLKINYPQLIFVMANFVQHSLVGSNQKRILNFFPLPPNTNEIVHHRFKKPIILKTTPGSVFHINLVDENFNPIKADIGTPTLLALKKSLEENMFPVTLISADETNLRLFPENKSNFFKNKLSFPLLLNQEHRWGVSLRSLAYPKVMNVYSKYCFVTVKKIGQEHSVVISLDNAYVTSGTKLVHLLNKKVEDTLTLFSDAILPKFSLKDGYASIETNDFECHLNGELLKILGLTHSYQSDGIVYHPQTSIVGVLEMNLFLLQPQEMIIISNIVEEAFYAQHRPKILKIVPISTNHSEINAYNYIQFEEDDTIPVKLDRIDEIEISIISRKGDLIDFVDLHDVKCQLEFKRMS